MGKRGRPPVERITVKCTACDKPLIKRKSDYNRSQTKRFFCDKVCQDKVGSKPRIFEMHNCELPTCGREFYPRSGAANRFCSKTCHDDSQRVHRVTRYCERRACGKRIDARPSDNFRYCSRACYDIDREPRPGDIKANGKGYVLVYRPDSAEARQSVNGRPGWGLEHRVVMADALGHALPDGSTVHHRNGVTDDNRLENLELWASWHQPGQRVLDMLDWARSVIEQYGPDETRLRALEDENGPHVET